jgi:hypothetical protein
MRSEPVFPPAVTAHPAIFLAGTRIATPLGWRTVERLRPSDAVLSPAGQAILLDTRRGGGGTEVAIRVPPTCLGNREEAILLPADGILGAEPGGLAVRLGDLPGYFGILRLSLPSGAVLVRLELDRPTALCVAHGMWVAAPGGAGTMANAGAASGGGAVWSDPAALLSALAERVGRALRDAPLPPPPTIWPGAG